MSDIIKSIIFGIIEGITEWLPVSSTGHLIIAEEFIKFNNASNGFYNMYSVVIQLGAVIAVATLFFKKINPLIKKDGKFVLDKSTVTLWENIFFGCIPAGIVGILFDDVIDKYLYNYKTVACTLIIYGILFIITERLKKNSLPHCTDAKKINSSTALVIGFFQILSLVPGTSRSGATVIGGMLMGMSRNAAAEFSFFMAIPVMLGASGVKLFDFGFNLTPNEFAVLAVGFVCAFAVSMVTVKSLLNFVKEHTFTTFGIYRIILAIAVILFFKMR